MANWTAKSPTGCSSRRKWNLEDRTSLNNLKHHFAAEGCSDVQYDLARQLLDNNIEQSEEASLTQGVRWLLCAAVQGHGEALKLLKECYDQRRGISEENEDEIQCCLSMTAGERAARKAARELFLCLSNGSEHITPKQLERKMRKIYKLQKNKRRSSSTSEEEEESDSNDKPLQEGRHVGSANGDIHMRESSCADLNVHQDWGHGRAITEENLVSAAVNYTAGRMPAVNDNLRLSIPHPSTLDHVPCFHRLLFHPVVFITLLYHRLISLISSFPGSVPSSVRLFILFFVYSFASSDNFTTFLPIFFYYGCLATMIWSTCKMLKTKHDFIDFRIWSGLFLSYGDNIEAGMSENRFLKNNMRPYLYFFCAFVGNLMVYPLIAAGWLPHSEITIISFVFVFVSMVAFMYTSARTFPDILILISFGVNVLAKYPYEMDEVVTTGWRFVDLKVPTFCSFVIGNGIEFCLNCRTVLYLMIPIFLVHIAKRSNWHGTYKHLIPHCVTLSWLQLCITTSRSATMFGVIRATLGLAGILLFLPLFGIISLLIPVFIAIEWIGLTDSRIRLIITIIAAALALLGSCLFAVNRKTQKYITIFQIIICIIAAAILTLPYMTSSFKDMSRFENRLGGEKRKPTISTITEEGDSVTHLTWDKFYALCGQPAWEHKNKVKAQLRCSHLDGILISWEGIVSNVQISRVFNPIVTAAETYLAEWLVNFIKCFYGDENVDYFNCDSTTDNLCSELSRILKANSHNKCNLNKWNTYEYEVKVRMSSGLLSMPTDIRLQATDMFGNFTKRLYSGDRIKFSGLLINKEILQNGEHEDFVLGTLNPLVKLSSVKCIQCQDKEIFPVRVQGKKSSSEARMRDLYRGIKYLLNVLLNPLITFK